MASSSLYTVPMAGERKGFRNDTLRGLETRPFQETLEIIQNAYQAAGPEIGHLLVVPNIVLAIAGVKGGADFVLPSGIDRQASVIAANSVLNKQGITIAKNRNQHRAGMEAYMLFSLSGLEQKTCNTKIPGIPLFKASYGFENIATWEQEAKRGLLAVKEKGMLHPNSDIDIILSGMMTGYPDTAILDCLDADATGIYHSEVMMESGRSYPEDFWARTSEPIYDYYPEHADDPEIQKYEKTTRNIWDKFYGSNWYKTLTLDPQYRLARSQSYNLLHNTWEAEQQKFQT